VCAWRPRDDVPSIHPTRSSRDYTPKTRAHVEARAPSHVGVARAWSWSVHGVDERVDALASFSEHFSPKIVGQLNDYKLQVVKVKGEFVWHSHQETDDSFLVLKGAADDSTACPRGPVLRRRALRRTAQCRALPESRRGGSRPAHRTGRHCHHRRPPQRADGTGGAHLMGWGRPGSSADQFRFVRRPCV
jgi:mannose-6-phosphate isomerase-like protein (cupin superfamily)